MEIDISLITILRTYVPSNGRFRFTLFGICDPATGLVAYTIRKRTALLPDDFGTDYLRRTDPDGTQTEVTDPDWQMTLEEEEANYLWDHHATYRTAY